jgi:hypothetical protein
MGECELAVLGVSKVRWNGNGRTETTNGYVFVYSGMPNADDVLLYYIYPIAVSYIIE